MSMGTPRHLQRSLYKKCKSSSKIFLKKVSWEWYRGLFSKVDTCKNLPKFYISVTQILASTHKQPLFWTSLRIHLKEINCSLVKPLTRSSIILDLGGGWRLSNAFWGNVLYVLWATAMLASNMNSSTSLYRNSIQCKWVKSLKLVGSLNHSLFLIKQYTTSNLLHVLLLHVVCSMNSSAKGHNITFYKTFQQYAL